MSLTSILSAEAIENAIKDCQGLSTFARTQIFVTVFIKLNEDEIGNLGRFNSSCLRWWRCVLQFPQQVKPTSSSLTLFCSLLFFLLVVAYSHCTSLLCLCSQLQTRSATRSSFSCVAFPQSHPKKSRKSSRFLTKTAAATSKSLNSSV